MFDVFFTEKDCKALAEVKILQLKPDSLASIKEKAAKENAKMDLINCFTSSIGVCLVESIDIARGLLLCDVVLREENPLFGCDTYVAQKRIESLFNVFECFDGLSGKEWHVVTCMSCETAKMASPVIQRIVESVAGASALGGGIFEPVFAINREKVFARIASILREQENDG